MHKRFERIHTLLRDAVKTQCTGIVARIDVAGAPVFESAFGQTRADDSAQPVYVDTRFDLASISKIYVATVALRLVASGVLELDAPLVTLFPEWRDTAHAAITVRMLLAHISGMNSGADYRQLLGTNVAAFTLERDLVAEPGAQVIYSDLGFITLGLAIERATGRALPAATRDAFPSSTLGFRPAPSERRAIVATEEDDWRGRVQGVVHDEKAYLMNGIAGHAGLFGTAADVAALAEAYLGPLHGRENGVVPAALARESIQQAAYDPVLRRGLGWALKTSDDNSCGRFFAMDSFGHTGFVGTCVWADPTRDLQAVLLTNTVYYGRSDSRPLRTAFYEAAVEACAA